MSKGILLPPNIKEIAPLSPDQVNKLGGALHRLSELSQAVIKTAANEAEVKGLEQYVSATFQLHAPEFIGMWFTAHEYRGLIQSQARYERRLDAFKHAIGQAEAAQVTDEATPTE